MKNIAKRSVYSLPVAFTALLFLVPVISGLFSDVQFLFHYDLPSLADMMQIEFLVLASGLLVGMFGVFRLNSYKKHIIRLAILGLVISPFVIEAYEINGFLGIISFLFLAYATYGASIFHYKADESNYLGILRWVISMFIFFSLVVYFDLGNGNINAWKNRAEIIWFGATFFSMLTILESTLYFWADNSSKQHAIDVEHSNLTYNKRINFYKKLKK